MAYSKDEIKQITDKVLNMCKADAVEVRFSGGERSATRFANSSITANMIQHDQEVTITVCYGQKTANATTHQFDVDAALPSAVNFGPAERAKMVKQCTDICEKRGVLAAGYIPKFDWVDASAN